VKAIQIEEFGGPDQFKLVDLPDPEPTDGMVVVDVSRSGINWADTHAIRNDYLAEQELPTLEPSGTRRSGGLISAFTGGLESRRTAVSLATLQALATMFHGILESRRG